MSKMKRIVVLLMIAMMMLAQAASAATPSLSISQVREEAAAGWHETIDGPKGPVMVDIDISVPEVELAFVLDVDWIHRVTPGIVVPGSEDVTGWQHPGRVRFFENDPTDVSSFAENVGSNSVPLFPETMDWDVPFMEDNPTTLREAVGVVEAGIAQFGLTAEDFDFDHPYGLTAGRYREGNLSSGIFDGAAAQDMGFSNFWIWQKFNGIPFAADIAETFSGQRKKNEQMPVRLFLSVTMMRTDAYRVYGDVAMITDTPYPDIPLCSVEDIKSAIASLISSGHIREIHSLQLGYVSYRLNDDPEGPLRLVPTWVLGCQYYEDKGRDTEPYNSTENHVEDTTHYRNLMFNAQSGEWIDSSSTSGKRSYPPEITSW